MCASRSLLHDFLKGVGAGFVTSALNGPLQGQNRRISLHKTSHIRGAFRVHRHAGAGQSGAAHKKRRLSTVHQLQLVSCPV